MMFKTLTAFVLAFALVQGKPYGDDNNDLYTNDDYEDLDGSEGYDEHGEEKITVVLPRFKTKPQTLMINEGATVRLPCVVDTLKGFVIMWKKGPQGNFISVGKQVVNTDLSGRFQVEEVENGNELIIVLAEEDDENDYTCEVSSPNARQLKHVVKIRVRPEVEPTPSNGIIVTKTGQSATLACQVTKGKPEPSVTWRRKEGRPMPDGLDENKGRSITFDQVTRHNSGIYVCSADNGFGEPTTAEIKLDVEHRPEIDQEETFIHTQEGDTTEVICKVHSSPKANVTWYKNGEAVDNRQHQISHRQNVHTLSLPITTKEAFGQYTCKATNPYGTSQKTTEVSGKAEAAVIKSSAEGSELNRFHLEWTADSFSPIIKFKVEFKEIGDSKWEMDETTSIKLPHEDKAFTGSYVIPRLRPATHYVARVSSQNTYGYSNPSQVFNFSTKGARPAQEPLNGSAPATTSATKTALTTTLAAVAVALLI